MKQIKSRQSIVKKANSLAKAKRTMASSNGMSLVEVVVALALLVIIMFFMSSTQLHSLKMNHKTGIIRDLTHSAEREMENRRQDPQAYTIITSSEPECFFEDEDYTCSTSIHPCSIVAINGEATIACVDTNQAVFPEAEAVSHQIIVDMVGPEDRSIRLQTIVEASKEASEVTP